MRFTIHVCLLATMTIVSTAHVRVAHAQARDVAKDYLGEVRIGDFRIRVCTMSNHLAAIPTGRLVRDIDAAIAAETPGERASDFGVVWPANSLLLETAPALAFPVNYDPELKEIDVPHYVLDRFHASYELYITNSGAIQALKTWVLEINQYLDAATPKPDAIISRQWVDCTCGASDRILSGLVGNRLVFYDLVGNIAVLEDDGRLVAFIKLFKDGIRQRGGVLAVFDHGQWQIRHNCPRPESNAASDGTRPQPFENPIGAQPAPTGSE